MGWARLSISKHHIVNLLLGTSGDDIEEADQVLSNLSELVARHMRISQTTYSLRLVRLAGNVLANNLAEPALVGGKYIFNAGDNGKSAGFHSFSTSRNVLLV